jgi:hypothetical protein
VAEQSLVAARQYRRHGPRDWCAVDVADRVHAGVDGDEATSGDPVLDRSPSETDRQQLGTGDVAVLGSGKKRDRSIDSISQH